MVIHFYHLDGYKAVATWHEDKLAQLVTAMAQAVLTSLVHGRLELKSSHVYKRLETLWTMM